MKLDKCTLNPILSPSGANGWENRCVLNPAVIYDESRGKFVMLYRAAGDDQRHQIVFGCAESDDGVHFERMSDLPVSACARRARRRVRGRSQTYAAGGFVLYDVCGARLCARSVLVGTVRGRGEQSAHVFG